MISYNRVHELTNKTFNDFIEKHDLVLVAFVIPDSSRNKRFSVMYEEAAVMLGATTIQIARVDATKEDRIIRQFQFNRWPTINLFKGSQVVDSYEGSWISSDLVFYARRQLFPAISDVTVNSLSKLRSATKILIVGYFDANDDSSRDAFESVANAKHRYYVFGVCTDLLLAEAERVHPPCVVLYKDFDEGKEVFMKTDDREAILSFINSASRPLLVDFLPETHNTYIHAGLPLGYIFIGGNSLEARSDVAVMIKPLAKRYRGRIQFGITNHEVSKQTVEDMHLDPSFKSNWSTFAIRQPSKDFRYLFDKQGQSMPSQQQLTQYLEDFFNGKLERSIKSEPVPEEPQQDAVQTIVGQTFDRLVLDSDRDVFVDYYTQWCGPCKVMAPAWEKLAQLFRADSEGSRKVMVGKIDAEANDVPNGIRGYPWLVLYPAGSKDKPIQYPGKRTVAEMANFIRDNGKYGIDVMKK